MSEWLIQESLKRDKIIDKLKLWIAFLLVALTMVTGVLVYCLAERVA